MNEQTFHCSTALIAGDWLEDCLIRVDAQGFITGIDRGSADHAVRLPGLVIPGMVNVHSHIHQRLIAGLTGYRAVGKDSFWTWREKMYRAVGMLSVGELQTLACYAFMELLEGGYTVTGEFHYPHRLGDAQPMQTALGLVDAADQAGMALTLLPVWYQYAGFGRKPPTDRQRPFVMMREEFCRLIETLRDETGAGIHEVGVAPHSLRAVDVSDLAGMLESIAPGPVHLHISEQPAEVSECLEYSGRTPIQLLSEQVQIDGRWCLIHATHATGPELEIVARSETVVGLCPTTEADLGDGLFPVRHFLEAGGRFAIGSDSNLVTDAASELRLLEWGQRLQLNQRNVLCDEGEHIGRGLWRHACLAGADALGQPVGELAVGRRADWLVLDTTHPVLAGINPDQQLDTLIFSGMRDLIDQVWVAGRQRVANGRHLGRDSLGKEVARLRHRLVAKA